jgi:hypothetical protein
VVNYLAALPDKEIVPIEITEQVRPEPVPAAVSEPAGEPPELTDEQVQCVQHGERYLLISGFAYGDRLAPTNEPPQPQPEVVLWISRRASGPELPQAADRSISTQFYIFHARYIDVAAPYQFYRTTDARSVFHIGSPKNPAFYSARLGDFRPSSQIHP